MDIPNFFQILRRLATYVTMFAALTAYGCITAPEKTVSEYNAAPLPSYTRGTTFVYSDGSWETVLDAAPSSVTWMDHRGNISSGSPDFTHRRSEWETATRRGTREFGPRNDLIVQSDTSLWPLRVGKVANYTETGRWIDKKKNSENFYRMEWSCAVGGKEHASVMAGEFDAWKIECRRYHVSGSRSQSQLREINTWYYAPEVGHYVLMTVEYPDEISPRRLELLAVMPPLDGLPAAVRSEINRSFQQALEFKKSGQSLRWSEASTGISVETTPSGTFRTPNGSFSRRYLQKFSMPAGQKTYYGMAVRGANGVWSVPRR